MTWCLAVCCLSPCWKPTPPQHGMALAHDCIGFQFLCFVWAVLSRFVAARRFQLEPVHQSPVPHQPGYLRRSRWRGGNLRLSLCSVWCAGHPYRPGAIVFGHCIQHCRALRRWSSQGQRVWLGHVWHVVGLVGGQCGHRRVADHSCHDPGRLPAPLCRCCGGCCLNRRTNHTTGAGCSGVFDDRIPGTSLPDHHHCSDRAGLHALFWRVHAGAL
jgi:hypothetical protein